MTQRLYVVFEQDVPGHGTLVSAKQVSVPLYDLDEGADKGRLLVLAVGEARRDVQDMARATVTAGPKGPLP